MGAVPRSLLIAARDIAVLTVAAFAGGTGVIAAWTQAQRLEIVAHPGPGGLRVDVPFVWADVAQAGWAWTRGVAVWLAVCWCATRARAGRPTVRLPVIAALVVVALRTILPLGLVQMYDLAWGLPPLLVALLVAAAWLGARAGRRPDDAASRHVAPVPRRGRAVAAVVVGLPVLAGAAAAIAAWYAAGEVADPLLGGPPLTTTVVLPLVVALIACALVSGTGWIGGALAAAVTVVTAGPPVLAWMLALNGLAALGVPAGMVVACAAAALWRPTATWGAELLGPARRPRTRRTGPHRPRRPGRPRTPWRRGRDRRTPRPTSEDPPAVRHVPRSLLVAARDIAILGAIGFALCVAVTGWSMRRDLADSMADHSGWADEQFSWAQAVQPSLRWTMAVLVWVAAIWLATRARTGRRTVWVPGVLGCVLVLAQAAVALTPPVRAHLAWHATWLQSVAGWPGPAVPFRWITTWAGTEPIPPLGLDLPPQLIADHPAWAYPGLVVLLLAAAAWLGARAGALPDDAASHRVVLTPIPGVGLSAAVLGLPTLGALAAATAAYVSAGSARWQLDSGGPRLVAATDSSWLVPELVAPLLIGLVAAALLSGCGRLAVLGTALVGVSVAAGSFQRWFDGGGLAWLGHAVASMAAIVAVALCRPAALWGAEILAPARAGAPLPPDVAAAAVEQQAEV